MRAVRIDWIDSCASNMEWTLKDGIDEKNIEPIRITSYGVIIKEDEDYIIVAQNYGFNPEQMCSFMSIPKGCIKEIKNIDSLEP